MARTSNAQSQTVIDEVTVADRAFADAAFPAAWGAEPVDQIAGRDLVEKASLIGVPFLIERVKFEVNGRGNEVVYVDAITRDGEKISFNDFSGKGIRGQLVDHLTAKGLGDIVASRGTVNVRIAVLRGVRASTFDTVDQATGKVVKATTYYLSASGIDSEV